MSLRFFGFPLPILIIAFLYISIPFLFFFSTAALYDLNQDKWGQVFERILPLQYLLALLSVVIAYSLIAKKKFGYYLFLFFIVLLASYNVWMILVISIGQKIYFAGVIVQKTEIFTSAAFTTLILGAIYYFLKREIAAPYLSEMDRGWRGGYRETKPLPFHWTNEDGEREGNGYTLNVSSSGCLLPLAPHHFLKEGDPINLHLKLENEKRDIIDISVKAVIVRKEKNRDGIEYAGVRFQFQTIQKEEKSVFSKFLGRVFAPRYRAKNTIEAGKKEANESSGELVNISSEGLYIKSEIVYEMGDSIFVKIYTRSRPINLLGIVRWSNFESRYGKPKGYGLELVSTTQPRKFKIWLWKVRFRIFNSR